MLLQILLLVVHHCVSVLVTAFSLLLCTKNNIVTKHIYPFRATVETWWQKMAISM